MSNYPTITINNARLETCWINPAIKSCPTLVFLHEGLGCIAMWRDFPQELCARLGLRGFVYSRAGYGGSDMCELPRGLDYMHVEGQVVLPQLLAAAGIDEAILVGHSDGGSIALIAAAGEAPTHIKAVITLAAHVFVEDVSISSIRAAKTAYEKGELRKKLLRHHGTGVDDTFYGWCDAWLDPDFRNWNLEVLLPAIKVPVLALQGVQDPYGTPAQVDAIVAGTGQVGQGKLIDDCGHNAHLEQREIVTEHILSFVRSV